MADKDTSRRDVLTRAGTVAWITPVITPMQAAPPMAGVDTSATTTTATTGPVD